MLPRRPSTFEIDLRNVKETVAELSDGMKAANDAIAKLATGQAELKGEIKNVRTELSGRIDSVTAELKGDIALKNVTVKYGEKAALKFNPYPGRLFRGSVDRVGARLRQDGEERFLIAEVSIPNPDGALKTGMLGTGKVSVGTRSVFTALFRRPARYLWNKIWPLLP